MLAPREKRTPDELITEGRAQAKALMQVVKDAGLSKDLGGSKPHLEVEAWQTIGRFNGYLTDIVWTRPVIEGGEKVGYEARAELVRIDDGAHVIGAEACCYFDEELEKRDGTTFKRWDDDYAVRSMAQTRAQSKLGRMAFAWVAVLAGYSGTPAEEMEGVRNKGGKAIVFPFGKHKDVAPSALDLNDLHRELAFWQTKTAEEKNERYKAGNQRLVDAIQEAIAEKTAKPETAASAPEKGKKNLIHRHPEDEKTPPAAAGPSTLDLLGIREKLWLDIKALAGPRGYDKDKVIDYIRKTHKVKPQDLGLEQVRALKMFLAGEPVTDQAAEEARLVEVAKTEPPEDTLP
jgi:CRISPR/Cas system CMR-associated protein Cmr5 small subunit